MNQDQQRPLWVPKFVSGFGNKLLAGLTTSCWGSMSPYLSSAAAAAANRSALGAALNLSKHGGWSWARQVHGSDLAFVAAYSRGEQGLFDGLLTGEGRAPVLCFFVDCVPIFLVDPGAKLGAVVHAGWRGTAEKIAAAAVARLMIEGASLTRLQAAIGPAIQGSCYQVGGDTAAFFDAAVVGGYEHEIYLDLPKANAMQLMNAGVLPGNIEQSPICCHCTDEYFSYRRQGDKAGRMAGFLAFR